MLLVLERRGLSLPQLALQLVVQHRPVDEAEHHSQQHEGLENPLLLSGAHPVAHVPGGVPAPPPLTAQRREAAGGGDEAETSAAPGPLRGAPGRLPAAALQRARRSRHHPDSTWGAATARPGTKACRASPGDAGRVRAAGTEEGPATSAYTLRSILRYSAPVPSLQQSTASESVIPASLVLNQSPQGRVLYEQIRIPVSKSTHAQTEMLKGANHTQL